MNHDGGASFNTQHGRLTMVQRDTFFQIHSSENTNLCIEVFKTLENVGRLWLRQWKSKGERGYERQMFGVTNEGKLHPSTKPSSCMFLHNNKNLRYRKDCASILNKKKYQFMLNFFYGTIFRMGDVTKVMTVRKLEEKKEVKLQRGSPTKSTKQHWTLRFEKYRVLGNSPSALQPAASCNSPTPHILLPLMPSRNYPPSPKSTHTPTKPPMHSGKHPSSLMSTERPTKALSPYILTYLRPPTTYQQISTRKDFNIYVYIWLKNNIEGEHATDPENNLYYELIEKYG